MVEPKKAAGRPRKTPVKPATITTEGHVEPGTWRGEIEAIATEATARIPEDTPEQREIAELKAQLAQLKAAQSDAEPEDPREELRIHFLDDGMTLMGVRYRGQEVAARAGTEEHRRITRFIENYGPGAAEQYGLWGRQRWGYGPFPGGDEAWLDRDDLDYGGPTQQEYKNVPKRKGLGPKVHSG